MSLHPLKRITFVQPPLLNEEIDSLAPPIGLLSVGAVLKQHGFEPSLIDFNLRGMQSRGWVDSERFFEDCIEAIEATRPDVVGLTSMALESHLALQIAQRIKQRHPGVLIMLGGPHFTSIAEKALHHYDWIDFIVCGEAEKPLIEYLCAFNEHGAQPRALIDNVAVRTPFGVQLVRKIGDNYPFSELPMPAYDMVDVDDYFAVNKDHMLLYEHARGCNLRCSFCYSHGHWGQGEQAKPIAQIIEELQRLESIGARNIFFVGDNFLNNKPRAIEIADAIAESDLTLKWHCYATVAQLSEDVVQSLGRAGCKSVFIGIDAVSDMRKQAYKKSLFKGWVQLRETLLRCRRAGLFPTCAVMLSPLFDDDEIEDVLHLALCIKAIGCAYRINHLNYYNGTELEKSGDAPPFSYSDQQARLYIDTPMRNRSNPFAQEHPGLFPFHQRYTDAASEEFILTLNKLAFTLIQVFPQTLCRLVFDRQYRLVDILRDCAERHDTWALRTRQQEMREMLQVFANADVVRNNPDIAAVLAFESLKLGRSKPRVQRVQIECGRVVRDYHYLSPMQVRLPCAPDQLATVGAVPGYGPMKTYVITPANRSSLWMEQTEDMAETISLLNQGGTVTLDRQDVVKLKTARLLSRATRINRSNTITMLRA